MTNKEKIEEMAQKTREKIKDVSFYKNPDTGNNALDLTNMREIISESLQEYGEWVKQQTLEEAIAILSKHSPTCGGGKCYAIEDSLSNLQALKDKNK